MLGLLPISPAGWPHHTASQRASRRTAPHCTSARERLPLAHLVGGTNPPDMSIPSHGRHANDCRGISHPSFSSFSRRNFTRGPVKAHEERQQSAYESRRPCRHGSLSGSWTLHRWNEALAGGSIYLLTVAFRLDGFRRRALGRRSATYKCSCCCKRVNSGGKVAIGALSAGFHVRGSDIDLQLWSDDATTVPSSRSSRIASSAAEVCVAVTIKGWAEV